MSTQEERLRDNIKRDELIKVNPNHPKLKKIDNLISQLEYKMKKV